MSLLLLAITLLLYGFNLIFSFMPPVLVAILFILTGIFLLAQNSRPHL